MDIRVVALQASLDLVATADACLILQLVASYRSTSFLRSPLLWALVLAVAEPMCYLAEFSLHTDPVRWLLALSPFYRQENRSMMRLSKSHDWEVKDWNLQYPKNHTPGHP